MAKSSPTSPAIALARASMNFARKQKRRSGVRSAMPTSGNEAIALVELTLTFVTTCTVELTPAALNKLTVFFQITIGRLIKSKKMGWVGEGRRREFSLECAVYLARCAAAIAKRQGSLVTPRVMDLAAEDMIVEKRPNCPLPNAKRKSPLKLLGTCCIDLAKEISYALQS